MDPKKQCTRRTKDSYNSYYIKNYYERHPEKRKENRLKDAIRLVKKNGFVVIPQADFKQNSEAI